MAFSLQLPLPCDVVASPERTLSLGGSPEMLLDNSNAFIYPASAVEWPHFSVSLFDNWGGALYPLSNKHVLGIFFNRPTQQLETLNQHIQNTGGEALGQLHPRPWFDLAYARTLSPSLAIGSSASLVYDRHAIDNQSASVFSYDLRLGLRIGSLATGALDLSLALRQHRLKDDSPSLVDQTTEGDGIRADLRYRWPIRTGLTLLPFLHYERDAFALASETRTRDSIQFGVGLRAQPISSVLLVVGLETRLVRHETASPNLPAPLEDRTLLVPAWVAAGQAQVGSLLFRLGMRQENWLTQTQQLNGNNIREQRLFESTLQIQLGLGMEFGPVLLDGTLERDFLRDGPHFIGGSRHGGGIFSQLGITYRFTS